MARRTPHSHPIMEPQTRFNLDQAIAAWRAELASHPGPAPEDLRTLEAHLRDGFAALRGGQLTDEEAFLVARHRVGPAEHVADEFAKAAPKLVWAPRVFWLAFSVLAVLLWFSIGLHLREGLARWMFSEYLMGGVNDGVKTWNSVWTVLLLFMPLILGGFWLARGVPRGITALLSTRKRVAVLGLGSFLILFGAHMNMALSHSNTLRRWDVLDGVEIFSPIFMFIISLLGLMIWLAPQSATTSDKTNAPGKKNRVMA